MSASRYFVWALVFGLAVAGGSVSGKTDGPLGIDVSYPQDVKVGETVKIVVAAWSTDRSAGTLKISVRTLDDGVRWRKGRHERKYAGLVARYERRGLQIEVVPLREGDLRLAVDVSRTGDGGEQSRSVGVVLHAMASGN